MVKKALRKNLFREIKSSFGRFIAILAIVALGVGLFAGLKVTTKAMLATGQEYFDENNLYDFRLISTLGLYDEDVEKIQSEDYVVLAEGAYSTDAIILTGFGESVVVKLMSVPNNINGIVLKSGRMPQNPDECIVDLLMAGEDSIGSTIMIPDSNSDDMLEMVSCRELTIVGICQSVLYANFERGNTSLGTGKVSGFVYVPESSFECEYYTEIYALTDVAKCEIYSDEYDDAIEKYSDSLEIVLDELAFSRYSDLKNDADKEISDAESKLSDAHKEIDENTNKIEDAKLDIEDSRKEIEEGYEEIDKAKEQLEQMKMFMPATMYEDKLAEIEANIEKLKEGEDKILEAEEEIEEAEKKIEDAKIEVAEHEAELSDAKEELEKLKEPDTYVLTRSTNIGYVCFESDAGIVEGIGNVFPVFFFLVAALVCMTTMSRMVEEKRTEIGTMKALGYSGSSIMGKYLFYSGSAAMLGCVAGFIVGSQLFPYVIWQAYGIMYTMKDIVFVFDSTLAIVSVIVSVLCSMGATYVTLRKELSLNAADLIRPKAPENGKRVLLERISFIWKRMSFTGKVSARNIFRYRKRFWMMILGVGGCYGLLITGFGIKDSIADVCDCQFNNIQKYGITVSFSDEVDNRDYFTEELKDKGEYLYAGVKTVDVVAGNSIKSANMVVISDIEDKSANDFINFVDEKGVSLELPKEGEVLINNKMARLLDLKIGDEIILRDPDLNEITVTVSGIMRNYVYNWAYINSDTYRKARGEEPDLNTAFVKSSGTDDYELGVELRGFDGISSVSVADEMSIRIDNMMESLNQIVVLVILCAAMLAFIVMYNLTNINITERMREIATLKVLGFYSGETALYVFRENLFLTIFGMIAGVFLGNALHQYVMLNITVEVVSFDTKILPLSYGYSVILTLIFALIVDLVLDVKLEKIKMAESLKSVE